MKDMDLLRNFNPRDDQALDAVVEHATDHVEHEWGWYTDHVPALVAEIRRLRATSDAPGTDQDATPGNDASMPLTASFGKWLHMLFGPAGHPPLGPDVARWEDDGGPPAPDPIKWTHTVHTIDPPEPEPWALNLVDGFYSIDDDADPPLVWTGAKIRDIRIGSYGGPLGGDREIATLVERARLLGVSDVRLLELVEEARTSPTSIVDLLRRQCAQPLRLSAGGEHAQALERQGIDPRTLPHHCGRCGEVEWEGCDDTPCPGRERAERLP
jgi:hypothetical protein